MEQLKPLSEILEPDKRMASFGWMLETDHKRLSDIKLSETIPEDIRNYFETVKNICLYGRFVYAFYGVAESLTYPLLELGLQKRLGTGKHGRKNSFRILLHRAIESGLIKDDGFSHARRMREHQAQLQEMWQVEGSPVLAPSERDSYIKTLASVLPNFRNRFAHPSQQAIVLPQEALFSIRFAAEFINQLYAK